MNKFDELAKEILFESPLLLLTIKDKRIIDRINNFLPYSTGFEVECDQKVTFDRNNFDVIPDIIEVNVDSSEQRFRIPNGLKGIICLYNICQQLKINSMFNDDSGIHYHIDMTDTFNKMGSTFVNQNKNWILNELSTWGYKGTYNKRNITFDGFTWVRLQKQFKTAEIRIGEMTFDYKLILKRIIHANEIVKKMKTILGGEKVVFSEPDTLKILNYNRYSEDSKYNRLFALTNQLSELIEEEPEEEVNINLVKNRTVKIS